MARQYFVNGVQIYEDGEKEYFVSGTQINEDQAGDEGTVYDAVANLKSTSFYGFNFDRLRNVSSNLNSESILVGQPNRIISADGDFSSISKVSAQPTRLINIFPKNYYAVSFNGTTQYLTRAPLLSSAKDYTVASKAKANLFDGVGVVFSEQSESALNPINARVNLTSDNEWRHHNRNDAGTIASAKHTDFTPGIWHDIVAVRRDGVLELWINGVKGTDATAPDGTISVDSLNIGAIVNGSSSRTNFWDGLIDDVIYWNRALSSTEIAQRNNNGNPLAYADFDSGLLDGVVAAYPFDSAEIRDASGNGKDLTLVGNPTQLYRPSAPWKSKSLIDTSEAIIKNIMARMETQSSFLGQTSVFQLISLLVNLSSNSSLNSNLINLKSLMILCGSDSNLDSEISRIISNTVRWDSLSDFRNEIIRLREVSTSYSSSSNLTNNLIRTINSFSRMGSHSSLRVGSNRFRNIPINWGSTSNMDLSTIRGIELGSRFSSISNILVNLAAVGEVSFSWMVKSPSRMVITPSVLSERRINFNSRSNLNTNYNRIINLDLNQASHSTIQVATISAHIKEAIAQFASRSDFLSSTMVSRPPISVSLNMSSSSNILSNLAQIMEGNARFASRTDFHNNASRIISAGGNFNSFSSSYVAPVRILNNGARFASIANLDISTDLIEFATEIGVILNGDTSFNIDTQLIRGLSIVLKSSSGLTVETELPNDLILTPVEFELLLKKTLNFNLYKGNR